jgi:hypothetical protein
MAKEMLGAKIAPRTLDRLEEYADKEGISKSEAADRMIKQGLDVQESDMRLVPVQADGGTVIEDELEHTQSEVNSLSGEVEELKGTLSGMFPPILLALVWIGATSVVEFPSSALIVSGLGVIAILLVSYYRVIIDG